MRKIFVTLLLLITVFLFQFCSSSKKAAAPIVNYQTNIQPIIQSSCAPCHIAGKGNKKSLDNYLAARDNVEDILLRIQKTPTDRGFMPKMHEKLSEKDIAAFTEWKKAGLLEH